MVRVPRQLAVVHSRVWGVMAGEVVLRQLFCRGTDCGVMFFICQSCYRGQVYCGDGCRHRMRRQQRRRANRRYEQDPEVRADHCQRQRAYRRRCRRERVTDHTSAGGLRSGSIGTPLPETGMRTSVAEVSHDRSRFERLKKAIRLVCIVCGRTGRWIDAFPDRE